MPWDWDRVSVLTRELFLGDLEDQIFADSVLFTRLDRKNKVSKRGGDTITERVILGRNPNVGSYARYDLLNTDETEAFGRAEWQWKHYYALISLPVTDIARNAGPEQLFSIIEAESTLARDTLTESITTDVYGDGTGNGGKNIDGLLNGLDDGSLYATYAGINRATYTGWAGNYFGNSGVGRAPSFALLNRSLSSTLTKKGAANFGISTSNVVDRIQENLINAKEYITHDEEDAKLGFENIMFRGRPIYKDEACPAGRLFWLNDNFMKLVVHSDYDFEFEKFIPIPNQHVVVGRLFWFGNLCIIRPNSMAILADLLETIG